MSKKSVIITLPGRRMEQTPPTGNADSWVQDPAHQAREESTVQQLPLSFLDLGEPRNALEFTWMMWTFPMRAWFYWASQRTDQLRPR